jgi:nitroreductase
MEMMDLVSRCRSYRRFDQTVPVTEEGLLDLIALARVAASAANKQPLKYVLSCAPDANQRIFETLAWAGYLTDWPGPLPGDRPSAYIIVLIDTNIAKEAAIDVGIAAQTILLGATARGIGGCMFGAVKRQELASRLGLPAPLEISLVIALGKPVEHVILEDVPADGSIKYYRTPDGTHHVPKRSLKELVHGVFVG